MKKLIIILALLIATPVLASSTLYEYYITRGEKLPSINERAITYADIAPDTYRGLEEQNIKLLSFLDEERLGTAIPDVIAVFETSLASKITSSQTTMTLVSGTTDDSTTISGTFGFVIDEGSSSQEFVLATCAGTACTSMTRGISTVTGTSTVSALKKSHRRGATVKITDHPVLATIVRILNGQGTLPSKLTYENAETISNDKDLATKKYIDDTALSGAPDASTTVKGNTEIGTATEIASSTPTGGTGAITVIPTSQATSTPYANSIGAGYVCVTEDDGNISVDCLPLNETWAFTASTTWGILPEFDTDPIGIKEVVRKNYIDNLLFDSNVWVQPSMGTTTTQSIKNANLTSTSSMAVLQFPNSSDITWIVNVQVPNNASSINSITIPFRSASTGNLHLVFETSFVALASTSAFTLDNTDTRSDYVGGNGDFTTGVITVPATAYDGITISENGYLGIMVHRVGDRVEDTYEEAWDVLGIRINFN